MLDLHFDNWTTLFKKLVKIPLDLYSIFMPKTEQDWIVFQINLNQYLKRSKVKADVIALQKKYGLNLRPNDTMRHTMTLIRLIELKLKNSTWTPPKED